MNNYKMFERIKKTLKKEESKGYRLGYTGIKFIYLYGEGGEIRYKYWIKIYDLNKITIFKNGETIKERAAEILQVDISRLDDNDRIKAIKQAIKVLKEIIKLEEIKRGL